MARVNVPPLLSRLQSARCFADQIEALRSLKNETVGHVQQKEKWVRLGALELVVKVLVVARPPARLNGKDSRASHVPARPLTEEEQGRLQALELLAIFASGRETVSPPPPSSSLEFAADPSQGGHPSWRRSTRPAHCLPFSRVLAP